MGSVGLAVGYVYAEIQFAWTGIRTSHFLYMPVAFVMDEDQGKKEEGEEDTKEEDGQEGRLTFCQVRGQERRLLPGHIGSLVLHTAMENWLPRSNPLRLLEFLCRVFTMAMRSAPYLF